MPIDPQILISAFLLGLLGSGHCLGMCGGVSVGLGLNTQADGRFSRVFAYNIGRISSYVIAGLIVGSLGFWLTKTLGSAVFLRTIAALMLILMGLYLGQWFNGLIMVEKLGSLLWRHIQPLAKQFLPVRRLRDAFLIGCVWGWLPCGLVYSALIWAGSQAHPSQSMLVMLLFGLGTLPSMLASGVFAQGMAAHLRNILFRRVAGSIMIILGIISLPSVQQTLLHLINHSN